MRFLLLLVFLIQSLFALEPNRSELDLPMTNEKLLVAHFMTADIDYSPRKKSRGLSRNMESIDPQAKFKRFGGLFQTIPMDMLLFEQGERSLDQVVEDELHAATIAGLDAFHFYYPAHSNKRFMEHYNRIILSFFKVGQD